MVFLKKARLSSLVFISLSRSVRPRARGKAGRSRRWSCSLSSGDGVCQAEVLVEHGRPRTLGPPGGGSVMPSSLMRASVCTQRTAVRRADWTIEARATRHSMPRRRARDEISMI